MCFLWCFVQTQFHSWYPASWPFTTAILQSCSIDPTLRTPSTHPAGDTLAPFVPLVLVLDWVLQTVIPSFLPTAFSCADAWENGQTKNKRLSVLGYADDLA